MEELLKAVFSVHSAATASPHYKKATARKPLNRNEYQKKMFPWSKALPVCRADNITAICEPIV
jgi:hypothetical protein